MSEKNAKNLGILGKEGTVFIMVDIQEKFLPVIHDMKKVIGNSGRLVHASEILGIPLIVTEQYPKGLGKTLKEIRLPHGMRPIEKTEFSCFGNGEFRRAAKALNAKALVIFGIEAHVCVLQTVLDALSLGYQVHVVADAISSRTEENKNIAMRRMRHAGAFIASTEMVLFQLLGKAGTEEFRKVSALVK